MKRKKSTSRCRECGEDGKYYYSRELARFLKIGPWDGTYFCDACFVETERKWKIGRSNIYDMLV